MKFLKLVLALAFTANFAMSAHAQVTKSQKYLLNNYAGDAARQAQLGTIVDSSKRSVRAIYDTAASIGSASVGAHTLGVTLPAGAVITRSWFVVDTQFGSVSGSGTVAIHCETANNIFTATDIDGSAAGTLTEGASTGAASAFKKITAACPITATVASSDMTAGKLEVFVDYSVRE